MTNLTQLLDEFRVSARRLETLQHYSEPAEQAPFDAYRAGESIQPPVVWANFVRGRRYGREFDRVRVVVEPLATYTAFELDWLYPPSVEAGEQIRIAVIEEPYDPADFWVFDDAVLAQLHYSATGALIDVEVTSDPDQVAAAQQRYNHYRDLSIDLKTYNKRRRNQST